MSQLCFLSSSMSNLSGQSPVVFSVWPMPKPFSQGFLRCVALAPGSLCDWLLAPIVAGSLLPSNAYIWATSSWPKLELTGSRRGLSLVSQRNPGVPIILLSVINVWLFSTSLNQTSKCTTFTFSKHSHLFVIRERNTQPIGGIHTWLHGLNLCLHSVTEIWNCFTCIKKMSLLEMKCNPPP